MALISGSYVVRMHDYNRIARWPDDGLEKYVEKNLNGFDLTHHAFESPCRVQDEITKLLGCWPCPKRFDELNPMGQEFWKGHPYLIQVEDAKGKEDHSAATIYLANARKNPEVASILSRIGLEAIIKCKEDRMPEIPRILCNLAKSGLANDNVIALLFGQPSHVRGAMMEIGSAIAENPPESSPNGLLIRSYTDSPTATLACDHCKQEEEPGTKFLLCGACKQRRYCNKSCQAKAWPLHHPECLTARGMPVPAMVEAKAAAAHAALREHTAQAANKWAAQAADDAEAFLAGTSGTPEYSKDCDGARRRADLPADGVAVAVFLAARVGLEPAPVLELNFVSLPEGLPSPTTRALWFRRPDTGGNVLLVHTRLFADNGQGKREAHAVDGVFVPRQPPAGPPPPPPPLRLPAAEERDRVERLSTRVSTRDRLGRLTVLTVAEHRRAGAGGHCEMMHGPPSELRHGRDGALIRWAGTPRLERKREKGGY
jgi:hypothetical protein